MRKLILEKNAIEDFEFWAKNDLKILKRTAELFLAVLKDPFQGIGKPEPLKGELKGYWSRRINEEHRIVYTVTSESTLLFPVGVIIKPDSYFGVARCLKGQNQEFKKYLSLLETRLTSYQLEITF